MKHKVRFLTDRINRFRFAALLLAVPTFIRLSDEDSTVIPIDTLRVVWRIGLIVLLVAIALDWHEVYRGKREVKKLIAKKKGE